MEGLNHYRILGEATHGQLQFFRAQEPDSREIFYLVAVPEGLPLLQSHPGLVTLDPLQPDDGTLWFCSRPPTGPSLNELWSGRNLSEDRLAPCVLQVVETLVHLASTTPWLLPTALSPDHIHRSEDGIWLLDLPGLALVPDVRLGREANVIRAIGELLHQLLEADEAESEAPQQLSSGLRFVMARCQWGGYGSLQDVRDSLTHLGRSKAVDGPRPLPGPSATANQPAFQHTGVPTTAKPQFPGRLHTSRLTLGVAALAVLVICATVVIRIQGAGRPAEASPSNAPPRQISSTANSSLSPSTPPASLPLEALPAPQLNDHLTAEPVFRPTAPEPPQPAVSAQTPQPIETPKPQPPAPQPEPLDPSSVLDKSTVGNNPVVVRVLGRSLGTAYMFTNPGAPVMSLDTFRHLLGRPDSAELSNQQLHLTYAGKSLATSDFLILDKRIWLVLKPELMEWLGLRITNYGQGYLDLSPKF